ncbi:MAG: hypothetical protein E7548_00240 [Ruminococcaceae bacterium]|nr:hypothetical protein [Oscillospiraceae bacterium]
MAKKADNISNGNIVSAIGSKADMSSANHSICDSAENIKENFKNRGYSFDESGRQIKNSRTGYKSEPRLPT